MSYKDEVPFGTLLGKTLVSVGVSHDDDRITFTCDDGTQYLMHHEQDCCEGVEIEDICGDFEQLLGEPILLAEEATHENENPPGVDAPDYQDSFTWTFYKLRTMHGSVTIRWYGESNGYYSESVDFEQVSDSERTS